VPVPDRTSAVGTLEAALERGREGQVEAGALATVLQVAVLAASAGALYALSFPPFSLGLAAWIALVPLVIAASRVRPASAAILGLLFALVAAFGVAAWLPDSVVRFFSVSATVGWLAFLAIALVPVGLPIAAFSAWVSWGLRRGCATPCSVGAAWAACELARSATSLGFLYAPLASSQVPGSFVQTVDLLGVYGVSGLIAAANVVVALPFLQRSFLRRQRLGESALVALACAAALVYGRLQLARSFDAGALLEVAIVQPGLSSAESATDAGHARYASLTRALEGGVRLDLVVWPEYAIADYLRERSADTEWLRGLSRELGADLILGAPHYRYAEPEPRYFTSAFLLRAGEIVARHDKTRLVPVAESEYDASQAPRVLPGERARVGAFLCAELLDASVARALVRDGAELLVNPANDFWVAPEASAQLLQIAALRAIENRRALVRATPTGFSAVIDAHGELRARSSRGASEVLEASIHASRAVTLNQRLGDAFGFLAAFFVVFISLRRKLEPFFIGRIHE
jgi:apolipoprotein N-acyltransferase